MYPPTDPAPTRQLPGCDGLLINFPHCVFSGEIDRTEPHVNNFRFALRKQRARPREASK